MKWILLLLATATAIESCSSTDPGSSNSLSIQVSNAVFGPQNKFTATVKFTNKLGSDINIINFGCMSTDSTFTPSFLMERFVNAQWDTFGSPLCPKIAVAPTLLSSGKSFTAIVSMLADTTVSGTFRLWFDIREQDITRQIPQQYLASNTFVIAN